MKSFFKFVTFTALALFLSLFTSCSQLNEGKTGTIIFDLGGGSARSVTGQSSSLKDALIEKQIPTDTVYLDFIISGDYSAEKSIPFEKAIKEGVRFENIPVGAVINFSCLVYQKFEDEGNGEFFINLYEGTTAGITVNPGQNRVDIKLKTVKQDEGTGENTSIIISAELSSIGIIINAMSGIENKLYYVGDTLDVTGLTVTAVYTDGTSKPVEDFILDEFKQPSLGTAPTKINVSYTEDGITKTADITKTFYVAAADAKPTEKPVALTGNGYTGGTYYKFGDYPQTISKLTNETDYTKEPVYNGFYLGSDGYFYAKCTEDAFGNEYTYSDKTPVGQDGKSSKYFKVEPIIWRVLTDDYQNPKKALFLAESILTANIPYYGADSSRTVGETTIYANNYKYSNIRAYLNGTTTIENDIDWSDIGFLQTAFTKSAQELIATTTVDNTAESTMDALGNLAKAGKYACDNTSDKIFLLSVKEVTTSDYGFGAYNQTGTDSKRIRFPTDYAKANHANYENDEGGWWWLRSPYYNETFDEDGSLNDKLRIVNYDGDMDEQFIDSKDTSGGVVPALWVSLE